MPKDDSPAPLPPGTEALFSVTCKDVVMGRGSGTQNHCGNVTYRKLVFLNKELYATSSKFDKLKISKAIVAAVRDFGGHFVQADEKRGGLYYDIGDKRAWDKTSQALREGQAEVRAKLQEEDPKGMSKVEEYKKVISEQTFFAYACKMMESLYHPTDGESGIAACGQMCPHAKRRQTLNQLGVHPMQIHNAMQSIMLPPLPPPQQQQSYGSQSYGSQSYGSQPQYMLPYNAGMVPGGNGQFSPPSSVQQYQGGSDAFEPLPYNAPVSDGGELGSLEPLPFTSEPAAPPVATLPYEDSIEPLPYQSDGPEKPGLLSDRGFSGGSVFSLRKFVGEDFELSSAEGKILMEQLNQEVDDLIRRKSLGLIQIDTKLAFEDLVFEEDSMDVKEEENEEKQVDAIPSPDKRKTTSRRSTGTSSRESRLTGLSLKDDMSLMNMSLLTLDERGESAMSISGREGEVNDTPKSIMRQNDGSAPAEIRKRGTRVSFQGRNMSLMSLDDRSFGQLVDTISDPEDSVSQERNISELSSGSAQSISRKMGFPMREGVAHLGKYGVHDEDPSTGIGRQGSDQVSTLTIGEDTELKSERDFTKLAGRVADPGKGVENSLTSDGLSISKANVLRNLDKSMEMSNMSLDLEDLLKSGD